MQKQLRLQLQKKHLKRITRCLSKIKLNPANWKIVQLSRRLHISDKRQKIEISFEHIFRHCFNFIWGFLHEFPSNNTINLKSVYMKTCKNYFSQIFVILIAGTYGFLKYLINYKLLYLLLLKLKVFIAPKYQTLKMFKVPLNSSTSIRNFSLAKFLF